MEKREREKAEEYDKERIKKIQEATQVEEEVARDYLEEAEYDTSKAIKEIISDKKKEEKLKYNDSKALSKEKLKTGKPEEKKEEPTKKEENYIKSLMDITLVNESVAKLFWDKKIILEEAIFEIIQCKNEMKKEMKNLEKEKKNDKNIRRMQKMPNRMQRMQTKSM